MAPRAQKPGLSQESLCEITGVSLSTRREWAKKGRLRELGRSKYEELDAVQLVAVGALIGALGPSDAVIAWSQLKDTLVERASEEDLVAMFDTKDKEARLESSIEGVRKALVYGHRAVVVDLAGPIAKVLAAFRRVVADN